MAFDLLDERRYQEWLALIVSAGGAKDRREVLESYVHLYIREEIQAEALVRSLPGFVRFLPVAALCHGQVINISGLARDCGVARTTVEGYVEILEDTLLAQRLPAFESRLRAVRDLRQGARDGKAVERVALRHCC